MPQQCDPAPAALRACSLAPQKEEEQAPALTIHGVLRHVFGSQSRNSFPNSWEIGHTSGLACPSWRLCLCILGLMAAMVDIVHLALLNMCLV